MIDQISAVSNALSTGQAAAPAFLDAAQPTSTTAGASPGEFSSMLSQMITETAEALHKAEATSVAAIQGKASIQDIVETVVSAEHSLQAAIAVRDKVTAAYLELSRMAI